MILSSYSDPENNTYKYSDSVRSGKCLPGYALLQILLLLQMLLLQILHCYRYYCTNTINILTCIILLLLLSKFSRGFSFKLKKNNIVVILIYYYVLFFQFVFIIILDFVVYFYIWKCYAPKGVFNFIPFYVLAIIIIIIVTHICIKRGVIHRDSRRLYCRVVFDYVYVLFVQKNFYSLFTRSLFHKDIGKNDQ